jgi:ribonuclease BN (tRNA processing enzyme)
LIELVILGSGTAIPRAERGSPGYLVRANDRAILMDCGPGALRAAAAARAGPADLDAVLVTHFHPDHNLDLQALFFALRNPTYAGRRPLRIFAPAGFGEILEHWWSGRTGGWLRPVGYEVELNEIGEGTYDVLGLTLKAVHVEHTPQSLAYRISETPDGPVLAYSGDTALCDGIVAAGRDADLLLLECANADANPVGEHLTPSRAAEVAERAAPRRLVLTHFYPEVEGEPIVEVVRRRYAGEVRLAADGDVYRVG